MGPFISFIFVTVAVNCIEGHVIPASRNESAPWNTVQYAFVAEEMSLQELTFRTPLKLTNPPEPPPEPTSPPMKPTDLTTKPTDPTKPTAPTSPTKPTDPTTKPTSPTKPTEPTYPTPPTTPSTKPTDPTKPTAPTRPTEPTTKPTTTWHTTTATPTAPPFTTPTSEPFTLPPHEDTAKMARSIVHFSSWGSLAYEAAQSEIAGYPSARVYSISDGYLYAGTGVPYFMVSPLDLTIQALESNDKCSLILSLSQTSYCSLENWDSEDPRCAQVILTGRFISLPDGSEEMELARRVLWDRHPKMIDWFINKQDHQWRFAKLQIEFITVIDYFGGRKYPSLSAYFSAGTPEPYGVEQV